MLLLEPVFNDFCLKLAALRSALRAVQVAAATEEAVSSAARELLLTVDEVIQGAERARKASRLPADVDAVRRVLPRCQRRFSECKQVFYSGMDSPERIAGLTAAGQEEVAWYIGRCAAPLHAAEFALSTCWRRMGEYSAVNPGGVIPGIVPPP